jgi:methylated-DNA-[protein]-cysteine S-methyltransferase
MKLRESRVRGPFFFTLESPFGFIRILWRPSGRGSLVNRIMLPSSQDGTSGSFSERFPELLETDASRLGSLPDTVSRVLDGAGIKPSLDPIDMGVCSAFQRRVLLLERRVPCGQVRTYGWLSRSLNVPNAVRAVGRALSTNPFPLVIPCHRIVLSSGWPGGYQGGSEMKKTLLRLEGVIFKSDGRVDLERH